MNWKQAGSAFIAVGIVFGLGFFVLIQLDGRYEGARQTCHDVGGQPYNGTGGFVGCTINDSTWYMDKKDGAWVVTQQSPYTDTKSVDEWLEIFGVIFIAALVFTLIRSQPRMAPDDYEYEGESSEE